jgi:N-acetylmuramoyl-L-alanine amidase
MSKYRIVLDYGHGGSKPGAVAGGIEEKYVNLMTGKALYDALHAQKERKTLQVLLTRDTDYDIPLSTRCGLINAHNEQEPIQLVLSVHYNAAGTPIASGFEAFHAAGSPLGPVAARDVVQAVRQAGISVRDPGVKDTDQLGRRLAILHNTHPTAVLLEVGYLTNTLDRSNAADPRFRSAVAQAAARGIWNYLLREEVRDA